MDITQQAVHQIYELAVQVFLDNIKQSDALKIVKNKNFMSVGSATNYIGIYKCMMKGAAYKRAMNKYSTEYFLRQIRSDLGHSDFITALSATNAHLDYYHTLENGRQVATSNLVESLIAEFSVKDYASNLYLDEVPEQVGSVSEGSPRI
jgi:5-methylcytosine-specific restriction protein A